MHGMKKTHKSHVFTPFQPSTHPEKRPYRGVYKYINRGDSPLIVITQVQNGGAHTSIKVLRNASVPDQWWTLIRTLRYINAIHKKS